MVPPSFPLEYISVFLPYHWVVVRGGVVLLLIPVCVTGALYFLYCKLLAAVKRRRDLRSMRGPPPKCNNSRACRQDRHGNGSSDGVADDPVVLMTASLFAKATKKPNLSAREQEEEFSDLFVLIRHGERLDHVDRAWKGNALLPLYDPPLSNVGRKQSFETALKYYALQQEKRVEQRIRGMFSLLVISPFHRCVETAVLMNIIAFEGNLPIYVNPLLSDWQQAKVFRSAPILGGYFCTTPSPDGESDNSFPRLYFCPQLEAIKNALIPFLRSRATEETALLEEYRITPEVASRWAASAERWVSSHSSLPVWTSLPAAVAVQERISVGNAPSSSQSPFGQERRANLRQPSKAVPPSSPTSLSHARICGVPHPEGKQDLVRRCEQIVSTHFLRCGTTSSELMVPRSVARAVEVEQKERLPKYFQTWQERPADDRQEAGSPALLPPMHVMAITHADVISTMLEVCCPKYHDKGAGYSVPYCSITALQRHNNYYRIPPVEERQGNIFSRAGCASQAQSRKGNKQRCHVGNNNCKRNVAVPTKNMTSAMRKPQTLAPLSVDWNVFSVGCTDLLRTRVVISYDK